MKTTLFTFLIIACTSLAETSDDKLNLGYEMQAAIFKTQDVGKVQDLLTRGIKINEPIGCGTFSPLDGAVYTQNVEMLKFLLAHGAKPRGRELAAAAFASQHLQALAMTKALLETGLDPNTREGDDHNALLSATFRENQELVRILLAKRGIKLDEFDADGFTALMWATKHGSSEIVDMLLHAGASVHHANKQGETAITVAEQEIQKRQTIITKLKAATK